MNQTPLNPLTLVAVLALPAAAGAQAPALPAMPQEWAYEPPAPGFWAEGEHANFIVACPRSTQRLEVAVTWQRPSEVTIEGTTRNPRDWRESEISFRIDDAPVRTEEWLTLFGWQQVLYNDEAVEFLRRLLPPARRIVVSAKFTDGETRKETFGLGGMEEMLLRVESDCDKAQPLLSANKDD